VGAAERAAVTELWVRVHQIVDREFKILGMKSLGRKGATSNWIIWKANLPPRVTLDWNIRLGAVELISWMVILASGSPTSCGCRMGPSRCAIGASTWLDC
jgi:hypothetical protein